MHYRSTAEKLDPRKSLTDQIYALLRKKLMTSEIGGNNIIVESKIAKEYGVSKTPVREALGFLKKDGFLEIVPRAGYRIIPITIEDVHEIYDLRILLEGEAAALVAQLATKEQLDELVEDQESMKCSISGEDRNICYLKLHDEFHLRVAYLSKNHRLEKIINHLYDESIRLRLCDPRINISYFEELKDVNLLFFDAFRKRDSRLARDLMRVHIAQAKDRLLAQLITSKKSSLLLTHNKDR